jgi:hypothetical protein
MMGENEKKQVLIPSVSVIDQKGGITRTTSTESLNSLKSSSPTIKSFLDRLSLVKEHFKRENRFKGYSVLFFLLLLIIIPTSYYLFVIFFN